MKDYAKRQTVSLVM